VKKLIFFSKNDNKVKEVKTFFKKNNINILSLADFSNFNSPKENGSTFEKNAEIKALFGFNKFNMPCFADDSGICIRALNDLPGVKSKRHLEKNGGTEKALNLIINTAKEKKIYDAYFKTSISLILEKNKKYFFNGLIKGKISTKLLGKNGFGYDPIFIPEGYNQTFAEMSLEKKSLISHRYLALKKLKSFLLESPNKIG
tara:strand:- start:3356 stop:3955 length:600 start_codon:yes stop_codon:yes gene_type:complete